MGGSVESPTRASTRRGGVGALATGDDGIGGNNGSAGGGTGEHGGDSGGRAAAATLASLSPSGGWTLPGRAPVDGGGVRERRRHRNCSVATHASALTSGGVLAAIMVKSGMAASKNRVGGWERGNCMVGVPIAVDVVEGNTFRSVHVISGQRERKKEIEITCCTPSPSLRLPKCRSRYM